ncbi:MAG: hypothetical protein QGI05_01300 [Candidatus Omnitrophota bacterium]|nr:hypothetical protein [Candidatus Omnitrophota bacterium]
MFIRPRGIKNLIIVSVIVIGCLFTLVHDSIAAPVAIKGVTKVQRRGGYEILVNYETREKWTDNLLFRVHCEFEAGEFTFSSSSLNNVERGWHKTKIAISDTMKKRYGFLKDYKVELYKDGMLACRYA